MTPLLAAIAMLPCVYWTQGVETRTVLETAGIKRLCVPPAMADAWKAIGVTVDVLADADLAARDTLPTPGIVARPGIASPTRSPWIDANGWRLTRRPDGKYLYDVPAGKAALAAAEAHAYGVDAVLKIDPADATNLGALLAFLEGLPPGGDLPPVADLAIVDDNTPVTGEVMNLLTRRNLLYEIVKAPSSRHRINIAIGSDAYPAADAADPSAFALKVRRQLTDAQRTLRVFGSEVVICRLTGNGTRARLHVINYAGREIEGLRILIRGPYRSAEILAPGTPRTAPTDIAIADGTIELSIPRLATYAIVDLR